MIPTQQALEILAGIARGSTELINIPWPVPVLIGSGLAGAVAAGKLVSAGRDLVCALAGDGAGRSALRRGAFDRLDQPHGGYAVYLLQVLSVADEAPKDLVYDRAVLPFCGGSLFHSGLGTLPHPGPAGATQMSLRS